MDYKEFKKKYKADTFNNYKREADKLKELEERKGYWYSLKLNYEKDCIMLEKDSNPLNNISIDTDLKSNNHLFGIDFGKYCENQIKLIDLDKEFKENNKNSIDNISTVKFNGTKIELMELVKALIENGSLRGKQKDIINSFEVFFNTPLNNPDKTIQDIKKRNLGSETLFLDRLKSSLYNFITKENIR